MVFVPSYLLETFVQKLCNASHGCNFWQPKTVWLLQEADICPIHFCLSVSLILLYPRPTFQADDNGNHYSLHPPCLRLWVKPHNMSSSTWSVLQILSKALKTSSAMVLSKAVKNGTLSLALVYWTWCLKEHDSHWLRKWKWIMDQSYSHKWVCILVRSCPDNLQKNKTLFVFESITIGQ